MQLHRSARPLLIALLVAAAPVGLSACSSSSSSSNPSLTTVASGGSATTGTPATSSFTCAKAPASTVNAALGTSVGAPTSQTNGTVTVCTYNSTSPIQTVIIRVDTGSSTSTFQAEEAQSAAHGETTTPVSGVGDAAYSLTVSGGGFTTNTFAVLKGTNEVQVNGPGTPAQSQALATQLVDSL